MGFEHEGHREKVERISEKVKSARERGEKPNIDHGSSRSLRPEEVRNDEKIYIGRLDSFLDVDEEGERVVIEPVVSMRELVDKTLEYDLIPYVVPEFSEITVGGGIQGGASESSGFRYGCLGENCTKFEIVTGNGEIIEASKEKNEDLFYQTMGSCGSLGILTGIEMKLRPAEEHVKLQYIKVNGIQEVVDLLEKKSEEEIDFLDAVMFEEDRGVVMVGWLHDGEEDLRESRFTGPRDEWFYIHAEKISREKEDRYEEKIPIKDYFFRYDIGAFWTVKGVFDKLNIPFTRFTRTLLHPFTDTSTIYNLIDAGNYSGEFVSQDIITKKENTEELMEWAFENVDMSALWLLPTTTDEIRELSPSNVESSLGINVGIWGKPKNGKSLEVKKALEQKQIQLGARKTLYAHQFYTEEGFWEIYDREKYQELREKYGAEEAFPSVYEKTHIEELPDASMLKALKNVLMRKV